MDHRASHASSRDLPVAPPTAPGALVARFFSGRVGHQRDLRAGAQLRAVGCLGQGRRRAVRQSGRAGFEGEGEDVARRLLQFGRNLLALFLWLRFLDRFRRRVRLAGHILDRGHGHRGRRCGLSGLLGGRFLLLSDVAFRLGGRLGRKGGRRLRRRRGRGCRLWFWCGRRRRGRG